jgi:hypothetical protein
VCLILAVCAGAGIKAQYNFPILCNIYDPKAWTSYEIHYTVPYHYTVDIYGKAGGENIATSVEMCVQIEKEIYKEILLCGRRQERHLFMINS